MTEALKPGDREYLIGLLSEQIEGGHRGEGSLESRSRNNHNDRVRRLLDAARSEGHAPERPMGELVERVSAFAHMVELFGVGAPGPARTITFNGSTISSADLRALIALTAPGVS